MPRRPEPEQVSSAAGLSSKIATFTFCVAIATIPVAWVPLPIGASVPLPLIFLAAFIPAACLSPGFCANALHVLRTGAFFWVGNCVYLLYLGVYSAYQNSDVAPSFFAGRLIILFAAFVVAIHTTEIVQRKRMGRIILFSALLGAVLFTSLMTMGIRMAGYSPVDVVRTFATGDVRPYTRILQMILSTFHVEGGASAGEESMYVFKNAAAESLAIMAALLLVTSACVSSRMFVVRVFLLSGYCAAVILSLSRSSMLALLCSVLWVLFARRGRWLTNRIILAIPFVLLLVLAVATSAFDDFSIISTRLNLDESIATRLRQYSIAITGRNSLSFFFGEGANFDYEGLRIHNLLVASWVEGGVIALTSVLAQYCALTAAALHILFCGQPSVITGRAMIKHLSLSLIFAGAVRTMFSGAGGYYTLPGMLCMGIFWGIYSSAGDDSV